MLSQKDIFKSRGYNVPTFIIDADGKRIEIETREDEEQSIKYDHIVTMLVNAGYFRAKIKGISPFDVIVGGITWCIDSSDLDLDVDLLFEEGLNTGQKIALTEKIVVVLPRIKCPHFIEPHQIQGLDFIHIYPVIKWLIKWSSENRKKKAAFLEEYAINQFHKKFNDVSSERFRYLKKRAQNNIDLITEKYQPRRQQKQTDRDISNLMLKIEGTLAEYGLSKLRKDKKYPIGPNINLNFKSNEINSLVASLSQKDYSEEKLNFENVEHILNSDFKYLEAKKKIKQLKYELDRLQKKKLKMEEEVENAFRQSAELLLMKEKKSLLVENLTSEEEKIVKQMQEMIQDYDKLKESEKEYKRIYKSELNDLESEISQLEADETDAEFEESVIQEEQLKTTLEEKKLELGKLIRSVMSKERLLEQIPTRAELSQYQKRFVELYNQMALKHTETKRYIVLYNTLNDKFGYLEKELNILNSIQDSYAQVITTSNGHEEFLRQLRVIAVGIQQTKEKIVEKRNENRRIKEGLHDHLILMQKQKSDYINSVKLLSDMYKKNEYLIVLLQRLKEEVL
ncbi:hypothetical protein PGB90_001166 [Kerria lacca]